MIELKLLILIIVMGVVMYLRQKDILKGDDDFGM